MEENHANTFNAVKILAMSGYSGEIIEEAFNQAGIFISKGI